MTDLNKENPSLVPNTREISCIICGRKFLFRQNEQEMFTPCGLDTLDSCPACRKAAKEQQRQEEEKRENEKWQREREKDI